jgi:hypothetical protein
VETTSSGRTGLGAVGEVVNQPRLATAPLPVAARANLRARTQTIVDGPRAVRAATVPPPRRDGLTPAVGTGGRRHPPPPGMSGARSPPRVSVQGASACRGRRCEGGAAQWREPVHRVVIVVEGWGFVLPSQPLIPATAREERVRVRGEGGGGA